MVPPNQAESMVSALRQKGLPVAYLTFDGEGHGFRRAQSIETALLADTLFLQGLRHRAGGKLPPLAIDNLPAA